MAEEDTKEIKGASSKGMWLWVAVIVLVSVGASIAVTLYVTGALLSGGDSVAHGEVVAPHPKAEHKEPLYVALDPPFVVNFEAQGVLRFLQVSIVLMTHDPDVVEAIKMHMPRIRNDIILLLTAQDFETLSTPEGKEKIRKEILERVQAIMKQSIGVPGVDEVYFTSFVMQ
ncbi:MAG: flagellar basal body protein FliL [Gammaproteobacteria bacterium]|nr:MAG: flagellar basal body protein FliL [Gammaproteobacteria bacterium]